MGSPEHPVAGEHIDRWRTSLGLLLLICLTIVLWEMVPATWQMIAAWSADTEQRAITRGVWLHLTPVAITLAEAVLGIGVIGSLLARTHARSQRWMCAGFMAWLGLQIVPRLVPLSWSYELGPELRERGAAILQAAAPLDAMASVVDLVPLLLAVTCGLLRAGAHHARRAPERAVGPLVVFAMSLQLALLAAVSLAFAGPLLPNGWLVPGLLLLVVHHAITACVVATCARTDRARAGRWLMRATAVLCALPGWLAVGVGLEEIAIGGKHLLALGDREGFLTLAELPRYGVHFVARACAAALAANDLIASLRDARPVAAAGEAPSGD